MKQALIRILCIMGFILPLQPASALVPSVFGDELEAIWTAFYHRDRPHDELLAEAEALWPRTGGFNVKIKLRERTHLRFMQGMIEQDREAFKRADTYFEEAERYWREWLTLEPGNGRTRVVGVEIRSMRLLGRGWVYALTNALSLDADLQQALKDAPEDPRVRTVAAMKWHYLPGLAGGSIPRAISLLEQIPPAQDPKDHFLRLYELALCYLEIGNREQALFFAQQALELYPRSHLALTVKERASALK